MTQKTVREILSEAVHATHDDLLAFESIVRLGNRFSLHVQSAGKWAGVVSRVHISKDRHHTLCNLRPNSGAGSWSDETYGVKFCDSCLALAYHKVYGREWSANIEKVIK